MYGKTSFTIKLIYILKSKVLQWNIIIRLQLKF